MAVANITPTRMALNEGTTVPAATSVTTDGALVDYAGQDTRILLVVTASSAATLTVKAGDAGAADNVIALAAGDTGIVLDSKFYKSAGKVKVVPSAAVTVRAVELI